MVAVSDDGAWSGHHPAAAPEVNGAGDVTAALFLAHPPPTGPRWPWGGPPAPSSRCWKLTPPPATGRSSLSRPSSDRRAARSEFPVTRLR